MEKKLLEKVQFLVCKNKKNTFEEAKNFLLDYLLDNPKETDAWLLLIIIECNSTEYPEKIIEYANNILTYDASNAYALLFLSYAQYYYLSGQISNETYTRLLSAKGSDPEIMAMIEIAKSRYFENRNDIKNYERALKKSISYSSNQQMNFSMLGILHLNQGKNKEGKGLIKKGLMNVRKISTLENVNEYDPINIKDFLDEFYSGIVIDETRYAYLNSLTKD